MNDNQKKRILIITAEKAGYGHIAASNAIEQALNNDYSIKQLNGFKTGNKFIKTLETAYIPTTQNHRILWFFLNILFDKLFTNSQHYTIYFFTRKKLYKEIMEYNPDLIISVQTMFTKAVSMLLKKKKLKIPFLVYVLDLLANSKVWVNKQADLILLANKPNLEQYISKYKIDPKKLVIVGSPINEKIKKPATTKSINGKINILICNPAAKRHKAVKIIKEVSKLKNTNITIVCGWNKKLYDKLTKLQKENKLSHDIDVLPAIKNMEEYMKDAHILISKGGQGTICEGIKSGAVVIISDHIPFLEALNYHILEDNKIGFKCEKPKKLYILLNDLISSKKINEYLNNAYNYQFPDWNKNIKQIINNVLEKH